MTFAQWKTKINLMRGIADRIARMRNDRAREACRLAGLDPGLLGIHPHNAMCGLHYGQPWPGIDYHYVRKCIWLLEREFEAHRIVDRWEERKSA